MKTRSSNLARLTIVLLAVLPFLSCSKSGSNNNADPGSFTWTWNGTTYNANFREAFIYSMSINSLIIGGTGTTLIASGSGPSFSVNALNVGTYNLGSGPTNYVRFVAPNGDVLNSTTGTLNITLNANNRLSGNFSATLINAASQTSSLTGSFSNIIISP